MVVQEIARFSLYHERINLIFLEISRIRSFSYRYKALEYSIDKK
jgi:hypothetical protein